ncbi:MAG: UDP-N-acetylmuramoyl-L-alanyl-D-glutamate--2,6-diaminopimelate ligase, partial [Ruminiclostridium sp.]
GKVYEAHLTTPRQMDLYRYFAEMAENGAEYCIMEASSQALAQYRICSEQFECAVFTNLTQDHLDYHGTMENYYQAKKMLFDMSKCAVVNIDGEYGKRLAAELEIPVYTYSTEEKGDYFSTGIQSRNSGISYWLSSRADEKSFQIDFKMPGRFNVANSVAAVAVCEKLGFDINSCVEAVQKCTGVKGRSEVIYDGDFTVICDYAHTEDALRKILTTIKSFATHRIICLFGAAGERDDTKRKAMGETVAQLADYAVVTSDNPRFEDPVKIIDQVMEGILPYDIPYSIYVDRLDAIKFALSEAKKGDIVALCGKGHETYQVIGDNYMDFDEHKIVAEIMKK